MSTINGEKLIATFMKGIKWKMPDEAAFLSDLESRLHDLVHDALPPSKFGRRVTKKSLHNQFWQIFQDKICDHCLGEKWDAACEA